MHTSSIMEIQSETGELQCNRLCRIIRRYAAALLQDQDAANDISQAFEEALDNAAAGRSNITLKVRNDINNCMSIEIAYPKDGKRGYSNSKDFNFENLFFTRFPDSIECIINGGFTLVRLTKRI